MLSSTSEDLLMEAAGEKRVSEFETDRQPSQKTAANLLLYNVALGQKEMAPSGVTLRRVVICGNLHRHNSLGLYTEMG